jgi:ornithine--oxo-acid transaminase
MDAHTFETTPSRPIHGMPLACLLGFGERSLTGLFGAATLEPRHVCLIGVRSQEPEEAKLLQRVGARVYGADEVRQRGLAAVLNEAYATVCTGTAGFGITIDLDVLDPCDAPCAKTPVFGGVRAAELVAALAGIASHPALIALEIAELNPDRDPDGRSSRLVAELIEAAFDPEAKLRNGRPAAATAPDPAASIDARPDWREMEARYGSHHYATLPVVLVRGDGAYVWDDSGKRYLDMMSAYSAASHGHCHPRILAALTEQAGRLCIVSRAYHNDKLPLFLRRLCEISGLDLALPANTGLEAVEAALKVARKWGYKVKGIPDNSVEIVCCEGNFHGRSIALVAMSSESQYKDGFGPYPQGFVSIPFGDAAALERAITPRTAAFLVEPIQGEGGIIVPPPGYLAACARVCRRHDVLLICDEVQTGLGRTGRLFAVEHDGVKPDGLIVGKALGGGALPISAFLARADVLGVLKPGDHGSTFGGNPLAAAVGLAAIEVMLDEKFAQRASVHGEYLLQSLRAIDSPLIREVRGAGLLIGVDLDPALVSARTVCERLLEHGVLSKDTHETVLRLAPPLVVTREQLEFALHALRATLRELEAETSRAA